MIYFSNEATNQNFTDFSENFAQVQSLQSELNLDEDTYQWLFNNAVSLGSRKVSMADAIESFLSENTEDEIAEAYIHYILEDYMSNGDISLDVLDPFEEYTNNLLLLEDDLSPAQTEIQNGIEILESYLPSQPQTPFGSPIGGSNPNPNGGPDLEFGTNGDLTILNEDNRAKAALSVEIQYRRMEWLLWAAISWNASATVVANNYLDQFHENGSVFDYYNAIMSEMVMSSTKMRNWLKEYGDELNQLLASVDGDIEQVEDLNIDRPAFNDSWAMKILINDTQKINVNRLGSYSFDEDTGKWEGYFEVNVIDHFGLDDGDVIEFQDHIPGGNGFIAWWTLQHRYGWAPFRTDVWFVVKLGGQI